MQPPGNYGLLSMQFIRFHLRIEPNKVGNLNSGFLEIDWRLLSAKACQDFHIGYATSMSFDSSTTKESGEGNDCRRKRHQLGNSWLKATPLHGLQDKVLGAERWI